MRPLPREVLLQTAAHFFDLLNAEDRAPETMADLRELIAQAPAPERYRAAILLGAFGMDVTLCQKHRDTLRSAVPLLAELLFVHKLPTDVREALQDYCDDPHPFEEEAGLDSPRTQALTVLAYLGPAAAPEAVSPLVALLEDPTEDSNARGLAAEALGYLASADDRALPALTRAIEAKNDPEFIVRSSVLGALEWLGAEAKNALPELKKAHGKETVGAHKNQYDAAIRAIERRPS